MVNDQPFLICFMYILVYTKINYIKLKDTYKPIYVIAYSSK